WRCARDAGKEYRLARYNRWYVYVLLVFVIAIVEKIAISDPIREHAFGAFQILTPSMEPTLLVGDHMIANKFSYVLAKPRRGDLAVYRTFEAPSVNFVKRIVGLPGETVEIRDRVVF